MRQITNLGASLETLDCQYFDARFLKRYCFRSIGLQDFKQIDKGHDEKNHIVSYGETKV